MFLTTSIFTDEQASVVDVCPRHSSYLLWRRRRSL